MKSLFEEMGGTYRKDSDYFIPNLELPPISEYQLGKYRRMENIVSAMARQENVTETLKSGDQMKWVRRMNSIRNRAE